MFIQPSKMLLSTTVARPYCAVISSCLPYNDRATHSNLCPLILAASLPHSIRKKRPTRTACGEFLAIAQKSTITNAVWQACSKTTSTPVSSDDALWLTTRPSQFGKRVPSCIGGRDDTDKYETPENISSSQILYAFGS